MRSSCDFFWQVYLPLCLEFEVCTCIAIFAIDGYGVMLEQFFFILHPNVYYLLTFIILERTETILVCTLPFFNLSQLHILGAYPLELDGIWAGGLVLSFYNLLIFLFLIFNDHYKCNVQMIQRFIMTNIIEIF